MTTASVEIDGSAITDFNAFHAVFKTAMGFPDSYGDNMNAWIDCMGDIHQDTKMSRYVLPAGEPLLITVKNTEQLSKTCPDIMAALIECTAFVNEEKLHDMAPIQLIFR